MSEAHRLIVLYKYLVMTDHKVSDNELESVRKEFRKDVMYDTDIRKTCFKDELFD